MHTLAVFLALTEADVMLINKIKALLKQAGAECHKMEELTKLITTEDLSVIVKIALNIPEIDKFCKDNLELHWETIWENCGSNNVKCLPQTKLYNFDLLKGIYLFWEYDHYNKIGAPATIGLEYLKMSAELGCFQALKVYCKKLLEENFNPENATDSLRLAKKAADLHLTPGYILLAKVCLLMANKTSDHYNSKNYYAQALAAVCMAEKLGFNADNEINNAYFKAPLTEILEFPNWLAAKLWIGKQAMFSSQEINNIYRSANIKFKQFSFEKVAMDVYNKAVDNMKSLFTRDGELRGISFRM